MIRLIYLSLLLILAVGSSSAGAEIVVIGDKTLGKLNKSTIQRIYTGRVIQVKGRTVKPVNISQSSEVRNQFLLEFLRQDNDKYEAYWTVRRFIGKGVPPKELSSEKEVIQYVRYISGAIGYIDNENIQIPEDITVLSE